MSMVKQLYADYCEAMHPNDDAAQDQLFADLCSGKVMPSIDEMKAKIKEFQDKLLNAPIDQPKSDNGNGKVSDK